MRRVIRGTVLAVLILWLVLPVQAQERSEGISIHMLPKRVAEMGGMRWGLAVDAAARLKPAAGHPVFQSAADLLGQDPEVQANGVWIVVTHPDAYSGAEKELLEEVKAMSRRENVPLFICQAAELPNGWRRYDR